MGVSLDTNGDFTLEAGNITSNFETVMGAGSEAFLYFDSDSTDFGVSTTVPAAIDPVAGRIAVKRLFAMGTFLLDRVVGVEYPM